MQIELTEQLFDTLRPFDSDTAWMFSNDEYFSVEKQDKNKVFVYNNHVLDVHGMFIIDPMFHTAGTFKRGENYIAIEIKDETVVLYDNTIRRIK